MEIFGKRPFVLKTAEMEPKIEDIHDVGGLTPNSESQRANDAISNARGWLATIAERADIYKYAQTHAEIVRKLLSKKTLSKEDWAQITHSIWQLGTDTHTNTTTTIYEDPEIENFKAAEIPTSFKRGETEWDALEKDSTKLTDDEKAKLLKDSKELETNCRKAKQQLKDMFEKVYKLTKSFVKDFEKARSKAEKDYSKKSSKGEGTVPDTSKMEELTEQYQKTLIQYKVLTKVDSDDQPSAW